MFSSAALLLLAISLIEARPQHAERAHGAAPSCPTGMHIVTARATTEAPGHGAMQALVDGLKEMYPGSDDFAIDYPADGVTPPKDPGGQPTLDLAKYQASLAQGYAALKSHLETYTVQCEETGVILLGYSQGAHVVGDVLCGNSNFLAGPNRDPIYGDYTFNSEFVQGVNKGATSELSIVKGLVHLGDPANIKDLPWHQGNGSYSGLFPRTNYRSCSDEYNYYGQSWCDDMDFFCEFQHWYLTGSIDVHLKYISRHKDEILAEVKKLIGGDEEGQSESFKFITQSTEL